MNGKGLPAHLARRWGIRYGWILLLVWLVDRGASLVVLLQAVAQSMVQCCWISIRTSRAGLLETC